MCDVCRAEGKRIFDRLSDDGQRKLLLYLDRSPDDVEEEINSKAYDKADEMITDARATFQRFSEVWEKARVTSQTTMDDIGTLIVEHNALESMVDELERDLRVWE